MKTVDLTHLITPHIPVYPGCRPPVFSPATTLEQDGFRETRLSFDSHTGTHMDAPAHLLPDGPSLDTLPVGQFAGPAVVIDCVAVPPGGRITLSHLAPYEAALRGAEFVLFHTGWDRRFYDASYYKDFPTPERAVAERLVQMGMKGVGIDAISIDPVDTKTYQNHRVLLEGGLVIVENLTRLEQVGDACFFCALPLLYEQSDGAPVRAVAFLEDAS
ncbi:MAG: cyclase family protein [Oscillospiraceae bacterium]|jgi:kynurenine formamidase